ncbi:pyroglutamyl peptidase [Streptomyces sp. NPDC058086]|uniref:pyroglutamyl peptidase n=1 Tax=Streptomyces sp. NPDC058086 TaxID=3346334 RepID=UPI0036F055E7
MGDSPPPAGSTVEEQRSLGLVPQEIVHHSRLRQQLIAFQAKLCRVSSRQEAQKLATDTGRALWNEAVAQAQERAPQEPGLGADDDRALYWTRLQMITKMRQWKPLFSLATQQRSLLIHRLETASRGMDSLAFSADDHVKRILVTGFDPFQLDDDIRRSNPSGAAALALDGITIKTASGPARIEAGILPVRWDDFSQGIAEHSMLPYLRPGPRQVQMFATISQGDIGHFDIVRYNGAWRGGFPDNNNVSRTGTIPIPVGAASTLPQPQWTSTSLPYREIAANRTGPFPVRDFTDVVEIPAGGTSEVDRPNGPTAGSTARAGGAGDYLSNEIAYRATALRDRLHIKMPGGHIHTPVLEFGKANSDPAKGTVTDLEFVRNRTAIAAQVRAIISIAADTLR